MIDTTSSNNMMLSAVIPAAGIGRRMQSMLPKQYLMLLDKTVLEHAIAPLLAYPMIREIIVVLSPEDHWFANLSLSQHPKIRTVFGGAERSDSVLAGLQAMAHETQWVLVHDAVRPCLAIDDLERLIKKGCYSEHGAILGYPVVDTIKQSQPASHKISHTVERSDLWHALTPQLFPFKLLRQALFSAQQQQVAVTDEASAMEYLGYSPCLITANKRNLKITTPEDLALAEYYLTSPS